MSDAMDLTIKVMELCSAVIDLPKAYPEREPLCRKADEVLVAIDKRLTEPNLSEISEEERN